MAFLTLRTPDVLHRNTVHLPGNEILVEPFVNAIEFISIVSIGIGEIHLGSTVTVYTPAHAEIGKLFYFIHLCDGSVTGLTLYFARANMLGMVKVNMVGQVVDLYPFDLFTGFGVFAWL